MQKTIDTLRALAEEATKWADSLEHKHEEEPDAAFVEILEDCSETVLYKLARVHSAIKEDVRSGREKRREILDELTKLSQEAGMYDDEV